MRERRLLRNQPRLWLLLALALVPAFLVTAVLRPLVADPIVALYLGVGLVGSTSWALLWLGLQQHCLRPFRETASFDDLRSAPLSMIDLADGLAGHALSRSLSSATLLLGPLALGLVWVDPIWRWVCLGILLRVLFLLLVGVPLASYLGLCRTAWFHGTRRDFGYLSLLAVMAPMASVLGGLLWLEPFGLLAPLRLLLVATVLTAGSLAARWLALLGLTRGQELTLAWRLWWDGLVRSARHGTFGWDRYLSNPMALRQLARESSATPGGPLSGLIWVYGPFLMAQALVLWWVRPSDPTEASLVYLALMGMVVFITGLRACAASQKAMSEDLLPENHYALRQTRLTRSQWVDGLALAAWLPRTLEALVLVLGTLPVAVLLGVSPQVVVPSMLLTLVTPICLAYTGLSAALEGSLGQLSLMVHLSTWCSLLGVYSAAILALRAWTAFETEYPPAVLDLGCLVLWLVVVTVPYVLDTRGRALRGLQV